MQRTALVTGGTRGLGKAIAIALKNAGYRVAVVYHHNEDAAHAFADATAIPVFRWDVSDFEACRSGIADIEAAVGPIDVLVNNAGITADAQLHRMTPAQWWEVINTNLGSMFNMSRNVIEGMRAREYGRIISISSINGEKGQFGQTNYASAKAGILGFTRALAQEGARKNVTANAIAPGYCNTDMMATIAPEILQKIVAGIPVGRLGTADDIARAVVFLADEQAGFITGATLDVNGGQLMD
jgi:acetoacetyl-CoA reductase